MTAVTDDADEPVTMQAYADRIGKSRPYVSKLVAQGRIRPPALTDDRKIRPRAADQQIAEGADPRKGPGGAPALLPAAGPDGTYARERARLTAAQAERAEIDLKARKGELLERNVVAGTLGPWIRELRDAILAAPRDTVIDPVQAADCEAALTTALAEFSARLGALAAETETHGDAQAAA